MIIEILGTSELHAFPRLNYVMIEKRDQKEPTFFPLNYWVTSDWGVLTWLERPL